MYIKKDIDFNDIYNNCWSGAKDTVQTISEEGKEEELMNLLEEIFCDETPTDTQVNDFLRFEPDYIFECLGISDDEEDEEEEEEEEEEEV